jgi:hypothetical protein
MKSKEDRGIALADPSQKENNFENLQKGGEKEWRKWWRAKVNTRRGK